jgi:hypothetical protein
MKPSDEASIGHLVTDGPPEHRAHDEKLWGDSKEDGQAKVGSPSMM